MQTKFPSVRPAKFAFQNFLTRAFGLHMDIDFRVLSALRPIGLALDIGGNWGQSIHALQRCASPGRILSFEPNRELADRLAARFTRDDTVDVVSKALADKSGQMTLYVPRYGRYSYDGLASIDREEARSWLNPKTMSWFDENAMELDEHVVEVIRLDDLRLSPDVVKIDVQGAEELVVRGGIETFERHRPVSIIENPSAPLTRLLGELGLDPYAFDGRKLCPHDGTWKNTIFMSETDAKRVSASRE
ncbi:FkbM family methyltransferase [Aurantiacibacter spongiae]|uniref:FkbM family methyltransferase n=1 Tax=Aurantiacibacter spongiae TaxID=2488860 RepID=A0A3N5CVK4_9SPHN|nr:FkbM family methyltransferase [Aurantiacibacter spongiae]RPF71510.1 FkbM family methyltransferase [Aurantiacibacter spongiae]